MLVASTQTLQDLGFTISESASKVGILVASKQRDAKETGQIAGAVIVGILFGANAMVWDEDQTINVTVVTTPIENSKQVDVRVAFDRIVRNNRQGYRAELLMEPKLYQEFFEKLSRASSSRGSRYDRLRDGPPGCLGRRPCRQRLRRTTGADGGSEYQERDRAARHANPGLRHRRLEQDAGTIVARPGHRLHDHQGRATGRDCSATKLGRLKVTATETAHGATQITVRVNAVVTMPGLKNTQVDDPVFYHQLFFEPLSKAMFVTALQVDDLATSARGRPARQNPRIKNRSSPMVRSHPRTNPYLQERS